MRCLSHRAVFLVVLQPRVCDAFWCCASPSAQVSSDIYPGSTRCREAEQLCAQIVDIETGNQLCYSNFWSCSNTMCHPQGCSVTCLPLNSNKACGTLSSSKRYFALRFPLQVPENLSISYNETSESKSSSVASNTFEVNASSNMSSYEFPGEKQGEDLRNVSSRLRASSRRRGPAFVTPSPGACRVTRTSTFSRQYPACGHDVHADTASRWREATFQRTYVKCPGESAKLYRTDFVHCNSR